jgi:hypothetical protein
MLTSVDTQLTWPGSLASRLRGRQGAFHIAPCNVRLKRQRGGSALELFLIKNRITTLAAIRMSIKR